MLFWNTPKFWQREPNWLLRMFLKPVSRLYSHVATKNYLKSYKYHSSKSEVLAVGAVSVGGSGKTIVVKSLGRLLQQSGRKVAVLSRGYGRSTDESIRVNKNIHSFMEVGDEPLLLSEHFPVFVCKDRATGAREAEQAGFNCLLLDDGMVQRYVEPNKKFLVIDNQQRLGNGEVFPLGPNRLPLHTMLTDTTAIFVLGNVLDTDISWLPLTEKNIPVVFGTIRSNLSVITKKVIAFCGIGYPDKFFNSLSGIEVIKTIACPDHAPFSDAWLESLINESKIQNAQLVTTEKDFMRIPKKYRTAITPIGVDIVWKDIDKVRKSIACL